MPRKRHTPEQIIRKLCEAEVELAKGQTTGDVARRLDSQDVLDRLETLFASWGTPKFIRSDNGSEFTDGGDRRPYSPLRRRA
jgi:hypothetical protein